MKIAIKNKSEWTYIDSKDLEIDGIKFIDIYKKFQKLENEFSQLLKVVSDHFLVKSNNAYIIEIDGELKLAESLKLYDVPDSNLDLKYFKVQNGKLVVDKNKIGGIL